MLVVWAWVGWCRRGHQRRVIERRPGGTCIRSRIPSSLSLLSMTKQKKRVAYCLYTTRAPGTPNQLDASTKLHAVSGLVLTVLKSSFTICCCCCTGCEGGRNRSGGLCKLTGGMAHRMFVEFEMPPLPVVVDDNECQNHPRRLLERRVCPVCVLR